MAFYSGVIGQVATFNDFFKYATDVWDISLSYRGDDAEPSTDEIEVGFGTAGLTVTDNGDGTWDLTVDISASDNNNDLYYLIFYR